jgi:hypothetical protein
LALTLGGGEVKLLDLTNAYAIFANQGRRVTPVAITKIVDYQGQVVYEAPAPSTEQVIRPEHAYLISSILSDNQARSPMFGTNSILNLPFTVAAKTGTTDDFRDNWTLGFTPDLAVGVWVGNPDNAPMQGTSGVTGAAPIWAEFMQEGINYLTGGKPSWFVQPSGIVEKVICTISGAEPSQYCNEQRREIFAADQPPEDADHDLWQDAVIDTWTGLEASPECDDFTDEIFALNVHDIWAVKWITQTDAGRNWADDHGFDDPIFFAPTRACKADDSHPTLEFVSPNDGAHLNSHNVDLVIRADASGGTFEDYELEWAPGDNPRNRDWETLTRKDDAVPNAAAVYTLDMSELPRGAISLRLTMNNKNGGFAEIEIVIYNDLPAPTAIPTNTPLPPTNTPLPTDTPMPSDTPMPTDTPMPSDTPMPPSETPSPTP